jgi:hypothetical protein
MPDDPLHDDATTAFLFQCGKSDLFAGFSRSDGRKYPETGMPRRLAPANRV